MQTKDITAAPQFARDRALVALLFYVACPVLIGFPMGWYQAGLGRYLPVAASCGLWISQWLLSWWFSEALLQGGKAVFRPWHLPFVTLLIIAAIGNILLARFWGPLLNGLFLSLAGVEDQSMNGPTRDLLSLSYVVQLVRASAYGAVYWCVLRYAYERYLNRPVVGHDGGSSPSAGLAVAPGHGVAAFPARLANDLRKAGLADPARVVALQAEDHYVRVHTDDGTSRLIYSRFADALAELKAVEGMQVHRSFWVRKSAIQHLAREGGNLRLTLAGGLVVPVSHKHRALLEFVLGGGREASRESIQL